MHVLAAVCDAQWCQIQLSRVKGLLSLSNVAVQAT
jgi:hypothetical protein